MTAASALPPALAALTAGSVFAYVLLDGWDLGSGILCPLVARRVDASRLFDSIAPFWDGNEIWLVFGAIMLLAGFPPAYAALMPHIGLPLFIMLAGLVLRGVGYEFQGHGGVLQRLWQLAFAAGSIAAALCQGWMLGLVVEGIDPQAGGAGTLEMIGRRLFPPACGVGVLGGYALLGSCRLISKTRGALQVFGREVGLSALILTAVLLIAISAWTLMANAHVARRWLAPSHLSVSWLLPAAAIFCGWRLKKSLWGSRDGQPLLWATGLFLTVFAGIAVSLYPFILPYRYSVFEAANDAASLRLAGLGVVIVLPLMIVYPAIAHRTFRRRVLREGCPGTESAPHMGARRTSGQESELHLS